MEMGKKSKNLTSFKPSTNKLFNPGKRIWRKENPSKISKEGATIS
jgi:hypothetical protein